MNKLDEIKEILDRANVDYNLYKVPEGTGLSSAEHLGAFGLDFSYGCSTLIFKSGDRFVAVMRRDDTKINNKILKKILGSNNLRFVTPEELKELTGYEVGMVSPITLKMDIFMDSKVLEKDYVRIGTGGNELSLEINTKDLQKVTNAKVVSVVEMAKSSEFTAKSSMRILSGITPSSSKGLHLGNYLGAVKSHIEFQEKGECFYFIADYHALNTVHDPKEFNRNVYETYLDYLALGIDTEKTIFFVESHVPSIFELTEILNNVVTLAQMKRMHAYKDKLADPEADVDSVNMGLFSYPILMAADILVFEPDIIPVGEDQAQHVEVCRDMAGSFNHRYGEILKVPELYIKPEVARVPGTDGVRKMSKSLGNDLTIFASEEKIREQVMGITTDPGRIKKDDPGDPEKNVIFRYMRLMDYDLNKINEYEERYRKGTIGDVELKEEFYKFFLRYFKEVRERREEISKDRDKVLEIMKINAEKANKVANGVIEKVREAIGSLRV